MMFLLRSLLARAACSAALMLLAAPWAMAQVTFNYTGAVQTYTVPAGVRAIQIQAFGAGGGGGGSDGANGGTGGGGMGIRAVYNVMPGDVLKIIVGGGGLGATGNANCTLSAGAAGLAGGTGGFAGGIGGRAGCTGFSGGGGGGGAATVVTTQANAMMIIAGGGGGGQGGNGTLAGRNGLAQNTITSSFGTAGTAGTGGGTGNSGGGGGGGGGCQGGAGGAINPGGAGPNTTTQAVGGSGCLSSTSLDASAGITVTPSGPGGGAGGVGVAQPGAPGAAGSVVITYPTLTLAKSQPSPALAVGVNSVYTLTVTNTNPGGVRAYSARVVDQLPSNMTYVSSSGTGWSCTSAANAGGTLVTCNFTGIINAYGGTAALQITAKPTTPSNVTNYAAVDPTGSSSPPVPTTCTAANTPAGCAAPVVSLGPVTVSGYAYHDLNQNNFRDTGEGGKGEVSLLYVKITPRTGSVCNGPATAAASVDLTSGAYSLSNVAQGNYCLILNQTSDLTDITPQYPKTGWIGTENSPGVIRLVVGGGVPAPQNFGLYNGSRVAGIVFADNGAGGGIANNGIKDGAEAGVAGITVNLTRGGTVLASAISSGNGTFVLAQPPVAVAPGAITALLPSGYLNTGGSAGTAYLGSYTRPSVNYTIAAGRDDTGIAFGIVAPNTLAPNGAQTAEPGGTAFYAHTWTATTGGHVTFTLANAASPANPGWSQVLYQDSNCDAALAATEPQVLSVPLYFYAGQKICLIVKQYVPSGASLNAKNAVTLSAAFSYTNAAPALAISTLVATDITTVSQAGDLTLSKLVGNLTQAIAAATSVPARPGDTLQYALTAVNMGAKPLSSLVVSDFTPAFTNFVSAACPTPLPAGMTGCAVTTQPAVGAKGPVQWTFTGSLTPGASMLFRFEVKLDQ